jgi:hypothetical protein
MPRHPPGRLNRKALAFESEIGRLHFDGYTSEAIRQALLDAGLNVSRSTVKREVARHVKHARANNVARRRVPLVTGQPAASPATPPASPAFAGDARSSKEIAEFFVKGRITNPVFRARSANESRGH